MSRLRAWRERLGLSQAQLAKRAGIHATYLSGAESGLDRIIVALKEIDEERRRERLTEARAAEIDRIWSAADKGPAAQLAKEAMLSVAWSLLDVGDLTHADQILDALPREDAAKLLDEFFFDPPDDQARKEMGG